MEMVALRIAPIELAGMTACEPWSPLVNRSTALLREFPSLSHQQHRKFSIDPGLFSEQELG